MEVIISLGILFFVTSCTISYIAQYTYMYTTRYITLWLGIGKIQSPNGQDDLSISFFPDFVTLGSRR